MALLGAYDLKASKQIYEVLHKTLSLLNTSSLIGYAVAYECTRTIATIYPDEKLIKQAAKCVGLFLVAKSNDIKYLGINALAALVEVKASFATEPSYQRIVIDCLDDPDETLKRKTLDLLCRITNAINVEPICDRLIKYLRSTVDMYFRTDLVARVTELAERYAPDNHWYISTMNEVLELGGELVQEEVAHNLMRLIAEGNEDEADEEELRRSSVFSYINLIEKPVLPDILVQVLSWVLGEYSYTVPEFEPESVMDKLCCLLDRNYSDPSTKRWIIAAIGKIISQTNSSIPDKLSQVLHTVSTSGDMDIKQRCCEIEILSKDPKLMQKVLPVDASCEDLEVDSTLSFLDDFVTKALQNGASPYKPDDERKKDESRSQIKEIKAEDSKLKLVPYELPTPPRRDPLPKPVTLEVLEPKQKTCSLKKSKRKVLEEPTLLKSISGVEGPWGPKGYTRGHGGNQSGSGDSESMSGSSSRSSGSERSPVLMSKTEPSPSPLVFTHDDESKQRQVNDLFKGVGNKTQIPGRKDIPVRVTGRGTRSATRKRNPDVRVPELPGQGTAPPPSPQRKYLEKDTKAKTDIDLLLNLDTDSQVQSQTDRPHLNEAAHEGLVTAQDNFKEFSKEPEEKWNKDESTVIKRTENESYNDDVSTFLASSKSDLKEELSADNNKDGVACREDLESKDHDAKDLLFQHEHISQLQPTTSEKIPNESLLDADISEDTHPLVLTELSASAPTIPKDLQEYPCSGETLELCSDTNIRVTMRKVYKPDQLVLVVFLTNQSQGNLPVTNVVTSLEPPSNLRALFDSSRDNRFVDDNVEPLTSVTHCLVLQYKSPALHMNLGGKVTYKDSTNALKNLYISHVIPIRDLVRPLVVDTDTFGDKWTETPFEKRQKIASNVKSCEVLLRLVEEGLGLNPIETIGSKAVSAGTVLQGSVCLLHGMVDMDGNLDIRIKTNSKLLSEAVMRHFLTILK